MEFEKIKKDICIQQKNLNEVYSKLLELTDGEEDTELNEYNNLLLDHLEELNKYLQNIYSTFEVIGETLIKVEPICENCNNYYNEEYCSNCGQEHIISEFILSKTLIYNCINNCYNKKKE